MDLGLLDYLDYMDIDKEDNVVIRNIRERRDPMEIFTGSSENDLVFNHGFVKYDQLFWNTTLKRTVHFHLNYSFCVC